MKRRDFINFIGFTAAAWPLAAHTQVVKRSWRIGFLGAASAAKYAKLVDALRDGLRDYGYVEGDNLTIEFRWAEGNNQRLPQLAAELDGLNLDCLVTHGTPGTTAAKHASATLPIVMAVSGDAVSTGLIKSLARPGGNVTGTTFFGPELAAKRIELLREALPNTRRVAVIVNPANPIDGPVLLMMEKTASTFDMKLQQFIVRKSSELESVFASITSAQFDAVAVFEDAITIANAPAIAQLAVKQRLPLAGFAELAKVGGLVGYGADIPALFRRAAYFVDQILHGAKPTDIPVEQPTKFDLVINLRTARSLGLTIPPTMLATADEVIE